MDARAACAGAQLEAIVDDLPGIRVDNKMKEMARRKAVVVS
jgi:hypothetical protein